MGLKLELSEKEKLRCFLGEVFVLFISYTLQLLPQLKIGIRET